MWQILGMAGGALVLIGYFTAVRFSKPAVLDWANIVGSLMMFYPNIHFGAYFGAMLTAFFGIIGTYGVIRRRRMLVCPT